MTHPASPASGVHLVSAPLDPHGLRRGLVQLVPELRGRALRLTGNAAAADDLVQDTIERALRFEQRYAGGTNLRAWAYQVLFSVFVTRWRRTRRERNALHVLGTDPNAWTLPEAPPAVRALSAGTARELEALPSAFRAVIVMIDLEERSYREAAEQLGVPLGTVMSRLHRGRKMLADRLRDAA